VPDWVAKRGIRVTNIIPLDTPGGILVQFNSDLYRSDDAGCTYHWVEKPRDLGWTALRNGAGGVVYGYFTGRPGAFRVQGRTAKTFSTPGDGGVDGLAGSLTRAGHVRLAECGRIWESFDYGATWQKKADPPVKPAHARAPAMVTFDAGNLQRAVHVSLEGQFLTLDGGKNWTPVRTDSEDHVVGVTFSPLDRKIVWGLIGSDSIVRSNDGGETFRLVGQLDPGRRALALHPTDPAAVLFWNQAETRLYDLHSGTGVLTERDVRDWRVFAPSPANPRFWYIGLGGPPVDVK
jgi:photosystem II stability/assembly factor-like uncharacterized protein